MTDTAHADVDTDADVGADVHSGGLPEGITAPPANGGDNSEVMVLLVAARHGMESPVIATALRKQHADAVAAAASPPSMRLDVRDGGALDDWQRSDGADIAARGEARVVLLIHRFCPGARIHHLLLRCRDIFPGAAIFIHHMPQ